MNVESEKVLLVKVGHETFGVPLMLVREVMEHQKPKTAPNMNEFFSGVINVRGALVGVADLRKFLRLPQGFDSRTTMLYFEGEGADIIIVVDRVEGILSLPAEQSPVIGSQVSIIPEEFVLKKLFVSDRLLVVADLKKLAGTMRLVAA